MATQIYSYTGTQTNANAYLARNTAFFDAMNDMVNHPPTGWTFVSSVLPTPSSTAYQVHEATFRVGDVLIRVYSSTGTYYLYELYVETKNIYGTSLYAASNTYGLSVAIKTGDGCNINFTLTRYYSEGVYDIVRCTIPGSLSARSFGLVYLTDKVASADDYLPFNDFANVIPLRTIAGSQLSVFGNDDYVVSANGDILLTDCYVYSTSRSYCGRMLNCKIACKNSKGTVEASQFSTVNGVLCLSITNNHGILIEVT